MKLKLIYVSDFYPEHIFELDRNLSDCKEYSVKLKSFFTVNRY